MALSACPPDVNVGPAPNTDPKVLTASDYCESIAPLFCPFYVRCGRMAVDDVDACLAVFAEACEPTFEARFLPLADAGLLSLSAEGLDTCAASLETVACDEQFFELEGDCLGIWEGHVEAGGACGLDAENFVCAPGTTCTLDLSFCGECRTVLALGDVCRVPDGSEDTIAGACGPAAVCGDDDVCVGRPVVNEACGAETPPCALPARCGDDGLCHHPEIVGVGDACDSQHRCPYRSACRDSVCSATAGLGERCLVDGDCDAGACEASVCVELLAAGAACARPTQCARGRCTEGICDGFDPICIE